MKQNVIELRLSLYVSVIDRTLKSYETQQGASTIAANEQNADDRRRGICEVFVCVCQRLLRSFPTRWWQTKYSIVVTTPNGNFKT